MEFQQKRFNQLYLIILLVLLNSLISGCASEKKPWAAPPTIPEQPPSSSQLAKPTQKTNCDELCNLKIAKEKIEYVKNLYNGERYQEAVEEIGTWTSTTEPWRNHLINSSGDLIIYLQLSVAYDRRDIFDKLLTMDNSRGNSTTNRIRSTATAAWNEFSKWLRCLYQSKRQRNQCMKYEMDLFSKVPEASKLVE
jgi:hypothetical protein